MKANQAVLPTSAMCTTLGVSTSGYYDWLERAPSARAQANDVLTAHIQTIHTHSRSAYGAPRIKAQLAHEGINVSRKRVARLMIGAQLQGISRRRGWCKTTVQDAQARRSPDLVHRQFTASAPDQLWVADMTYLPTHAGFTYLAMVIDVFSRKVVGWQFSESMTVDIVLDALNMALVQRKPNGVIHHSDQGSQYTSIEFGARCKDRGVRPSMGTVGSAYDNAMAESFFASLECELINQCNWKTKQEASSAVFSWIESWYNPTRLHSSIGYVSPNEFEENYQKQQLKTQEALKKEMTIDKTQDIQTQDLKTRSKQASRKVFSDVNYTVDSESLECVL